MMGAMSAIVAVLNQKGGVGKTTLTLGLASAAWAQGVPTLVVDLDPQGNATWTLGVDPSRANYGTGDALAANRDGAAADMIVPSGWGDGVWLLPASGDLTDREADVSRSQAPLRLRRALTGITDRFELVLVDCAPSLGLNTTNGLAVADGALLVAEPSAFGLRGITGALDLIDDVWQQHNPDLSLLGVVLNKVPGVSHEAEERMRELSDLVGARAVWTPPIPHRVLISEAHGERSPIHAYGRRANELIEVFDTLLGRLRRATRAPTARR
jgi:chromosome partitioning protein